tara:strand:+ start:456 stop:1463 length:1008 start_codon:yes stop_codon:yes gene_type:complete
MAFLGSKTGSDGIPKMMFTASKDWTPAVTYEAMVYVIGAGGSGAMNARATASYGASGGGAGGCAVSRLMLNASSTYVITIGVGGRSSMTASGGQGSAGTNTTFVCSAESISITGTGGGGGVNSNSGSSKGVGGTPTGGNIANYKGGDSIATPNDKVSGGGAVGLFDVGLAGANVADDSAYQEKALGDGGNLHGSMGGASYGSTEPDYMYHSSVQNPPLAMAPFGDITASISGNNNRTTGTTYSLDSFRDNQQMFSEGGNYHHRSSTYKQVAPSGPFAGGNGIVNTKSGVEYLTGGFATLGGGGGGACNEISVGTAEAQGGHGGRGVVLIFPLSVA